jgi:hypothetical protein
MPDEKFPMIGIPHPQRTRIRDFKKSQALSPIISDRRTFTHYGVKHRVFLDQYFAKNSFLPQQDGLQTHQLQQRQKG